ncbi:hypothetical protein Btru_007951 [Bulinus truncatus]|nr:hypothetical protein Btru_007951 [Bulinus truncatus]
MNHALGTSVRCEDIVPVGQDIVPVGQDSQIIAITAPPLAARPSTLVSRQEAWHRRNVMDMAEASGSYVAGKINHKKIGRGLMLIWREAAHSFQPRVRQKLKIDHSHPSTMSSYFMNSLATCYGPATLDPCTDPISGYDRSPYHQQHHHHQQQQPQHGSVYAGYAGHQRYPGYHHSRPAPEPRYVESAASQYYSTPRLTHLSSGSPSPPPASHAHISSTPGSLSPSTSPHSMDRKLSSGINGSSLTPSGVINGSVPTAALPGASTLQKLSGNVPGASHGAPCDNGYYPNPGLSNFLDENTPSCDSPPLAQRQKANKANPQHPQQQHPATAASPSSPPSPPSKLQRSSDKCGSPNSQSEGNGSSFQAPQIYPWMRRMQYSAGDSNHRTGTVQQSKDRHCTAITGPALYNNHRTGTVQQSQDRHCTAITGPALYSNIRTGTVQQSQDRHCTAITGPALYSNHRTGTVQQSQDRHCTAITGPALYSNHVIQRAEQKKVPGHIPGCKSCLINWWRICSGDGGHCGMWDRIQEIGLRGT